MNYTELKTEIAAWNHRSFDAGKVDLFIDLFEARVNRNLRVPEMEKRATATPSTEYVALPSDFLELRNIQINGTTSNTLATYVPPELIDKYNLTLGVAKYYSIVGNEFQFAPSAAGSTVEIAYYGKITPLSDANPTNFLIDSHPDYYLMGCIHEALIYSIDDRAAQVAQMVAEKEVSIIREGKDKRFRGPTLSHRTPNRVI